MLTVFDEPDNVVSPSRTDKLESWSNTSRDLHRGRLLQNLRPAGDEGLSIMQVPLFSDAFTVNLNDIKEGPPLRSGEGYMTRVIRVAAEQ